MKLTEFKYNDKPRSVFVLKTTAESIEGIDVSGMSDEERTAFEEYIKGLEPFMRKHYRRFLKEKVSE